MTLKPYTRRAAQELTSEILGQYHALIAANDLPGYERLLTQYQPGLDEETKRHLLEEFKLVAEQLLRRRWRTSK